VLARAQSTPYPELPAVYVASSHTLTDPTGGLDRIKAQRPTLETNRLVGTVRARLSWTGSGRPPSHPQVLGRVVYMLGILHVSGSFRFW